MHLERKLRRNLQTARTAAAKEGVPDANVTSGGQMECAATATCRDPIADRSCRIRINARCDSLLARIGYEIW